MDATKFTATDFGYEPGRFHRASHRTRQRRAGAALITIVALIAGIAVGFKMFDQSVGNNVVRDASNFNFRIEKQEASVGDTGFTSATASNPIFGVAGAQYPGDSRTVDVRLTNTNLVPSRAATFYVFVESIGVTNGANVAVPSTDPLYGRFISFFTLNVAKATNSAAPGGSPTYANTCSGGFRDIIRNAPCNLGNIGASGSTDRFSRPTDQRLYRFTATEADDGTDQSAFKGWTISFSLVFQAQLPALAESGAV